MALDPLTWLFIASSIIATYCLALKLSERPQETQIKETPEPWSPISIPQEPRPQATEISADVIQASENPSLPSQGEEQPENKPRAPAETRKSSEEKEEGPRPEPISKSELMELEKEIKELRILLEMSAELKKELEKLAKIIKTQKPGKTVN